MANNKERSPRSAGGLDISPAVMGYGNKKSTRNPGGNKRKKVSEYGTQLKEKQKVQVCLRCAGEAVPPLLPQGGQHEGHHG